MAVIFALEIQQCVCQRKYLWSFTSVYKVSI